MINYLTAAAINRKPRISKLNIQKLIINAAMLVSMFGLSISVVSTGKLMTNNQLKHKQF
ncbi:hypothetical protein BpHYR1_001775 [Brachionus plicatilis]|uniref:Uncharacterized protein n=1 Tax=Brachionus plicatilis TaxID=10195 RepID=A0A3M7RL17_BRAPC|nr:hypothetical protein BpHYR1_001775 [Brachionus plicatilis]